MSERWDDFLRYPCEWTPRMTHRVQRPPSPIPARTLGEARARHIWVWAFCARPPCHHLLSMPLAPLIIRWGADMLIEEVRARLRCQSCGRLGPRIEEPMAEAGDLRCIREAHRWTGRPEDDARVRFGVPEGLRSR